MYSLNLREGIVIDPEAVLECFRISESGPASAGPVPTLPSTFADVPEITDIFLRLRVSCAISARSRSHILVRDL